MHFQGVVARKTAISGETMALINLNAGPLSPLPKQLRNISTSTSGTTTATRSKVCDVSNCKYIFMYINLWLVFAR